VTDAIWIYPLQVEAAVLQPVAEVTDPSWLSTDVHDQVDIVGGPGRINAVLGCEQPYHLAPDQAPASRKDLREVKEDPPALMLGRGHGFSERYRSHQPCSPRTG
jgi:hypothetical protein